MLKEYFTALKNVFFPVLCFSCGQKIKDMYLCARCQDKIEFLFPPLCRLCSMPIADNKTGLCGNCIGKKHSYEKVISVAVYKEPLAGLIQFFKYKHCEYLASFFSSLMTAHLEKTGQNFFNYDFIVCVPLHVLKLKEREYNQSAILAHNLSNYFKIPFKNDIIYEVKNKPSQTTLSQEARKENVKGAFKITGRVSGKRIVLVDDIFTTGSTIDECARILKENGADTVAGVTLCKTL